MPKKYTKKGGGLWDSFGTTFGNLKNSISSGASNLWNKTKKATSGMNNQSSNNYNPTNSYNSTPTNDYGYSSPNSSTTSSLPSSYNSPSNNTYDSSPVSSYAASNGGSKRKHKHVSKKYKKRGGYGSSTSLTNLASTAGPIKNVQTAKAHHWVGGKSKCSCKSTCKCKNKKRRKSRRH